jgi:hypothetical protein
MGDQKFIISSSSVLRKAVKPLIPAAFAVVSTHHPALVRVVGFGPFSLSVIHKEGLCPSSGDIIRLMITQLPTNRNHLLSRKNYKLMRLLFFILKFTDDVKMQLTVTVQ